VTNILANPDFASEFDSIPFRRFNTNGNQIWDNFMSGSWAWMQAVYCSISSLLCLRELNTIPQDKIAKDLATHGSMFVPIILRSDKTTVSVATGQNKYYPLYMSIGNAHNGVHWAH
jgi:Plavaka transposase